jgi:Flp pilus assembly protein TadB
VLKKPLTEPKLKKIDLHFPLGLEVTARNLKGVTIKDALDAIHKQFKKKVRDCP